METSPLAKLSPELRSKIYSYIIPTQDVQVIGHPLELAVREEIAAIQPAITRTCKQLRKESLQMYYANNQFRILLPEASDFAFALVMEMSSAQHERVFKQGMVAIKEWVTQTPKTCHALIKKVRIAGKYQYPDTNGEIISCYAEECENLQKVLRERGVKFGKRF